MEKISDTTILHYVANVMQQLDITEYSTCINFNDVMITAKIDYAKCVQIDNDLLDVMDYEIQDYFADTNFAWFFQGKIENKKSYIKFNLIILFK